MCNPQLFTPFMAWKGLFQHLEGLPMDDYYEFKCVHEIQIKEWQFYWSPNYVFITKGIVAPSGATATLSINLASGNGNTSGNGATTSGGIIGGGSARASTSTWGPLPTFNPIVEFFCELQRNYQKVRTKKLWSLQDFQRKPHESLQKAYAWTHRLIMVRRGVTKAQIIQF